MLLLIAVKVSDDFIGAKLIIDLALISIQDQKRLHYKTKYFNLFRQYNFKEFDFVELKGKLNVCQDNEYVVNGNNSKSTMIYIDFDKRESVIKDYEEERKYRFDNH